MGLSTLIMDVDSSLHSVITGGRMVIVVRRERAEYVPERNEVIL